MSDGTDAVTEHHIDIEVVGPWSLRTSRRFWEGFSPNELVEQPAATDVLHVTFLGEADWHPVTATVRQDGATARISVVGSGDLDAAAAQVQRFLAIDVDAREWPSVADRDAVIARAQADLPGLRPCGFFSPYEAAAWSVLSQRIRITQAATLRRNIVERLGVDGAFPAPSVLAGTELDLPGRKSEYLRAVAEAALDGRLATDHLRAMTSAEAVESLLSIAGIGPFGAELTVLRGANVPDAVPQHEQRLEAEISEQYGPDARLDTVSAACRPFRTWAVVHLRALREARTNEIRNGRPT